MKIWLDDERNPAHFGNDGWVWVKTPQEFFNVCVRNLPQIEVVSLDNDLGDGYIEGHQVLAKIEEIYEGRHPPFRIEAHSANPVARARMLQIIKRMKDRGCAVETFGVD